MFSPNIGCQLNPTFILSQIFKWLGYNKCCQYAGINAMAKVLKQKVIATKIFVIKTVQVVFVCTGYKDRLTNNESFPVKYVWRVHGFILTIKI